MADTSFRFQREESGPTSLTGLSLTLLDRSSFTVKPAYQPRSIPSNPEILWVFFFCTYFYLF